MIEKWTVSDLTSDKTSIVTGKVLVAEAHHGTSHSWAHGIDIKEAQTNARLIAAAPDLLVACEAVLADCKDYSIEPPYWKQLKAAIAAAKT